jgi:ubiquinone/menaquinone biosynthesis C-methylase UbiE
VLRQHIGSPYPDDCRVTGIDVFEPMLREAARHIDRRHNIQLFRMDAAGLTFRDQSFDAFYAAYVISVVPDRCPS